ncbi:MAG: hypothetical protein ACOYXO_08900 [Chloroflexota bacterium]
MAVITRKGLKLAAKKVAFLPVRVMLFGLEVLLTVATFVTANPESIQISVPVEGLD